MHPTRTEQAVAAAGHRREAQLGKQAQRKTGSVHTPPVLARYLALAADQLAREHLGLPGGLADHRVVLVDPACGPGAFLAAALAVAAERVGRPRLAIGLDRDPAAIATARALLRPALARACWDNELAIRDTLEAVEPITVARRGDTAIVLGNPPWIASAQSPPSPWLDALLEDYRRDDSGERLPERKLGVLTDAYVRFIRWSAEVVRLAPSGGLLALVTNGSYLDGPVQRAMRLTLLRHFDHLRIVDLGGNALLARPDLAAPKGAPTAAPTGASRDGNVFGVRTSAAVLLAVRTPDCDETRNATVEHHALSGSATEKLATLEQLVDATHKGPPGRTTRTRTTSRTSARTGAPRSAPTSPFEPLTPAPPFHRFVPTAPASAEYQSWPSLADAMPFHREGIQTNRDAIAVAPTREALLDRLRRFAAGEHTDELAQANRPLGHYDPESARAAVRRALEQDPHGTRNLSARPLLYRPFDLRWFAPITPLCHRPRPALLQAIDHSSAVLVSVRKDRSPAPWQHFAATTHPIDNCLLSSRSSCRARAFPTHTPDARANLAPEVAAELQRRVGRPISSPDYLHYTLAVLASPTYRKTHQQALQQDYPRIPWPRDRDHFQAQLAKGQALAALFHATTTPPPPPAGETRTGTDTRTITIGHHKLAATDARIAGLARAIESA